MIWFLIVIGIIFLAIYFWYVTIPIIILVVLWFIKDDIKKIKNNHQKKSNNRHKSKSAFSHNQYSENWNLTEEFNISESEARSLFGYNFREYSTTKDLYNRCHSMHKDPVELASYPKYMVLTLSLIFDRIYKSYEDEAFKSKIYRVSRTKEQVQEDAENIQLAFRNVFENYEFYRTEFEELSERRERQRRENKSRQKSEQKSEQKSKRKSRKKSKKSTSQSSQKKKSGKKQTIHEKRIQDRLEKFQITERDAEIIFGSKWEKILSKPEYEFFYDVWTLDIKITYDTTNFRARLGSLYTKLLEIIRIVDEENPEQARGKKSQKSRSYRQRNSRSDYRKKYEDYNYNSYSYSGFNFDDDDEDEDEDDDYDDYEESYDSYDGFDNNYEDDEKISWAYSIFGLDKGATIQQVKTKYRELSLKFHPDRNSSPDATLKMSEINNAYELLSQIVGAAS